MKVGAAIVAVAVAIVAAPAMAGKGDWSRSASAGFEIRKPAEWHDLTAEQNQENLSRVELADDEYKTALLKDATVPLVALLVHTSSNMMGNLGLSSFDASSVVFFVMAAIAACIVSESRPVFQQESGPSDRPSTDPSRLSP